MSAVLINLLLMALFFYLLYRQNKKLAKIRTDLEETLRILKKHGLVKKKSTEKKSFVEEHYDPELAEYPFLDTEKERD